MDLGMTRRVLLVCLAALLLCGGGASAATDGRTGPAAVTSLSTLEARVLQELNAVRRAHGLRELTPSTGLAAAARGHSFEMVERGFFSHRSADGSQYWDRIAAEYPRKGHSRYAVSENLLWASPTINARGALRVWMDSPPHRRTILDASWREIGVAAVASPSAPGKFRGATVTVITLDFGVRQ
jgi:uncharacterized protein YkwD